MDNEFQWRSQMRKLNEAVEPSHDLWPGIAASIAQEPAATGRRGWQRPLFAIAASLLIAVGAGLAAYQSNRPVAVAPIDAVADAAAKGPGSLTALDWATPTDPKLAAAAEGLDKASADLQAALEARPDAVFLVGLLNRTNAQRMRLMRQSAISG